MNEEKELTDEEIVKALADRKFFSQAVSRKKQKAVLKGTLDLIHRQKAEIERLTEENAQRAIKTKCENTIFNEACLTVGIVKALDELEKQKKENAELQKQVDELKLDLENWKKAAYGYKYAEEQAVKDTAKEIYEKAKNKSIPACVNIDENPRKDKFVFLSDLENIIREKGVEVE